ncbi:MULTISPECIES: hypothetical protein [Deinococcus]|uniref:Uncharacterized protein n=1 Tax=Deinococcus cavernae TaxID=2320857 RepID=A0A418VAL0_9DEIO|nr:MULTISPECIES: hypothetical protein [Deinococcus]RJF73099.1 hypothetical protein D3875_17665 [Deinococcus cavernae]
MRFPALPCALVLASVLSGCARTADNFAPRIFVTSPASGGVSQIRNPMVKGYVLDDTGVTRITVNGKSIPLSSGTKKIANFQFQAQVPGAKADYALAASDAAGHETKVNLPISVDATKPTLSVKSFTRFGRNGIRVTAVATDNIQVAQVTVDGNRLNITPGKRVDIYAETTGIYADIEVLDQAGNKTFVRAQ